MQIEKYIERLKFLHDLIGRRSTGRPEELASRIGVSKRMIFEYLNELKAFGAPIAYSRKFNSYFYTCKWRIEDLINKL